MNINKDILIKAIEKSSLNAFNVYHKMTNGEWISYTPEYWYTCGIARGIKKKLPQFSIHLENSVSEIRTHSGPTIGRPSRRLSKGYADITIWQYWDKTDEWDVKSLIEVKRAWNWDQKTHGEDLDRLAGFLKETEIENVFFVILSDQEGDKKASAQKRLKRRFKTLGKKVQNYLDEKDLKTRVDGSYKLSKKIDNSRAAVFVYALSNDNRRGKKN